MTERELLKVEQAAQILNLGRSTTYGMVAAGDIPSIRVGRALRIPRRLLTEWIERRVLESESSDPAASESRETGVERSSRN